MNDEKKLLWDVDHPYYCSSECFFTGEDIIDRWNSWNEWYCSEGDCDPDLNLLFRWDWKANDDGDDYVPMGETDLDCDGKLFLFWMSQRKGHYRVTIIKVCRADELQIRKWLQTRLNHLVSIWKPLKPEN